VGLGGETRNVFRLEERLKEATRLGYRRAIIPDVDAKAGKLQLVKVKDLNALADALR
jgi:predicted ATP-dependent serine protease